MACGIAEGGALCADLIASIPTHEWAGLSRRASRRGGLLLFFPLGLTADSVKLRRVLACERASHGGPGIMYRVTIALAFVMECCCFGQCRGKGISAWDR